ncbi:hypothetical protein KBC04_00255 [Candidatus Babeliales bacterium]|nr:hypothetical protein [Candidatus Babeliales bacterium]MBP9843477.1 hypothetical protein [Candidatus Babeliales bacterium]
MHSTKNFFIKKQARHMSLLFFFLMTCNFATAEESVLISQTEYHNLIAEADNDILTSEEELLEMYRVNIKKPTTLVVYIAADNDLHPFAWKNIKQMEAIGSNENINIIVQINTPGYFNPTKRYIIKNGKRLLVPAEGQAPTQKLNSGNPQTLIDCVAWAMKYYPADNLVLNLWNHGAGVYDPGTSADYYLQDVKLVSPFDLFRFDPTTNMIYLDRSVEYIISPELITENTPNYFDNDNQKYNGRGICFDETFKSFLTNQDLKFALSEIQTKVLQGKKIGVVWFDACLMAMIEIADICKEHASYLVASQEVEYASGSNYELVLSPFVNRSLTPREIACHIVNSYEKAYQQITRDFTQSATDLSLVGQLESNINLVAAQLLLALQSQKNNSVVKLLQKCKSRQLCICFQEPSFIDARNFYMNLQANLNDISLINPTTENTIKYALTRLLDQGIGFINAAVIANKTGINLQRAGGLSIYFPERGMFNSYPKCSFAKTNNWSTMLSQYLLLKK